MISLINIFLTLASGITIVYNVRSGKKSGLIYVLAVIPLMLIALLMTIMWGHGRHAIKGNFENIGEYEVRYFVDARVPDRTLAEHRNLKANFIRPTSDCSLFDKIYAVNKCKREIQLEKVFSAETLTDPPYGLNFGESNCIIEDFNKKSSCIDDHGHTWDVTLLDEKAE